MPANYIAPEFGIYAEKSTVLARAMTKWLFADPKSNPFWNKPEMWERGPRVKIVKRGLDFLNIANGSAPIQKLSLIGGKNAIVFSSMATIKLFTVPAPTPLQIPNEYGSYVTINQKRTDGFVEIDTMPLNNAYGTVPGWPVVTPAPEFWMGNSDRVITITNNWGANVSVNLSWTVAMLDTGR